MSAPGGKAYRPWTPELYAQQVHAPATKLPEDDLVFFLLDVVPTLDLARIHAVYQDETRGAPGRIAAVGQNLGLTFADDDRGQTSPKDEEAHHLAIPAIINRPSGKVHAR